MPRVPQFNPRRKISTDVSAGPTQDVRSAGMVDRANQQLAKGIGDFAFDLGKRRALSKRNYENDKFDVGLDAFTKDLEEKEGRKREATDWDGYADSNVDNLKEYINKAASNAPTQQIADDIRTKGENFLVRKSTGYRSKEFMKNAEFRKAMGDKNHLEKLNELGTSSKTTWLEGGNYLRKRRERMDKGMGIDYTLKSKLKEISEEHKIAEQVLSSMINSGRYKEALDVLEGKFEDPINGPLLFKALGGKRIEQYKSKIKRIQKANTELLFSNAKKEQENYEEAFKMGKIDPNLSGVTSKIENHFKTLEALPESKEKDMLIEDFKFETFLNNAEFNLLYASKEDRDNAQFEVEEDFKSKHPILAEGFKIKGKETLNKLNAKIEKEIHTDGGNYFSNRDKPIREASDLALLGFPEGWNDYKDRSDVLFDIHKVNKVSRNYINDDLQRFFGDTYLDAIESKDYKTAVGVLQSLKKITRKDATLVSRQLKIPAKYAIINEVNTNKQEYALRLLTDSRINKKYEDSIGKKPSAEEERAIRSQLMENDYYKAVKLINGGNLDAGEHASAILDVAHQNYKGLVGDNFSAKTARTGAFNLFSNTKVLFSKDNYALILPEDTISYAVEEIKTFAKLYKKSNPRNAVKDLNIKLDGYTEEAMNSSIKDTGMWVTSPDGNSMRLFSRDPSTGRMRPIPNNKGNIVDIKFSEADKFSILNVKTREDELNDLFLKASQTFPQLGEP